MALNLNKENNNDKSNSNGPEKKGLNLTKSGVSSKPALNLSKEPAVTAGSVNNTTTEKDGQEKKKSPFLLVSLALLIVGGLIYLFFNNGNSAQTETNAGNGNVVQADSVNVDNAGEGGQNTTEGNTSESQNGQVAQENTSPGSTTPIVESSVSISSNGSNASTTNTTVATPSSASKQSNSANSTPSASSTLSAADIEEKAKQVMDGVYGNGKDRIRALGENYSAVQAKVNEIYKNKLP
jgi:hypothetical protein